MKRIDNNLNGLQIQQLKFRILNFDTAASFPLFWREFNSKPMQVQELPLLAELGQESHRSFKPCSECTSQSQIQSTKLEGTMCLKWACIPCERISLSSLKLHFSCRKQSGRIWTRLASIATRFSGKSSNQLIWKKKLRVYLQEYPPACSVDPKYFQLERSSFFVLLEFFSKKIKFCCWMKRLQMSTARQIDWFKTAFESNFRNP